MQSLERGLAVIRAFGRDRPAMTVAEVARACELTRATARRVLHTLVGAGYATVDGTRFVLTPRVLDLGYAYLSSVQVGEIALPVMETLSAEVHESVSAAVLDGVDVVYVARVAARRIMAASLSVGSRLPAVWTSMGRAILASLPDAELDAVLAAADLRPPTSGGQLVDVRDEIVAVRSTGYALVDQELEAGVRSVAVPVRDGSGRTIAAMNVSTHAGRVSAAALRSEVVPRLVAAVHAVEAQLARR